MKPFFRLLAPVLTLTLFELACAGASAAPRETNLWWMPDVATRSGERIDQLTNFIYYLTAAVFVLTQVVYVYFLVKYRAKRGVRAKYSHGDNRLELVWTAVPTAIFIGLWGYSNHLWWDVIHSKPPADALEIAITGYQFGFNMQYGGKDGQLGHSDVKFLSNENVFGNDPDDPLTKDNFQSGTLTIPVNQPLKLRLKSKDVIHAFYVPEFRIYQDLIPGRSIDWVWFEAIKPGSYQIACNQLCGSGHYNMKAQVEVLPKAEYDKWYQQKTTAALREKGSALARSAGFSPSLGADQVRPYGLKPALHTQTP
jgi:cytochrome c oxidase subunit 2